MAGWEKLKQTERDKMDQNVFLDISFKLLLYLSKKKKREKNPLFQTIKISQVNKRPWSLSFCLQLYEALKLQSG